MIAAIELISGGNMRPGVVASALRGLVIAGIASMAGCGPSAAPEQTPAERGRLVVALPAISAEAVERVSMLGDVQGEVEVRVFAQLPERIRALHVH